MLSRPPSSPAMAILKPSPSAPSRLADRHPTTSKITARVGCAFQPILRLVGAEREPGRVALDDEGRDAAGASAAGARHHDVDVGVPAPEMNCFCPFST